MENRGAPTGGGRERARHERAGRAGAARGRRGAGAGQASRRHKGQASHRHKGQGITAELSGVGCVRRAEARARPTRTAGRSSAVRVGRERAPAARTHPTPRRRRGHRHKGQARGRQGGRAQEAGKGVAQATKQMRPRRRSRAPEARTQDARQGAAVRRLR